MLKVKYYFFKKQMLYKILYLIVFLEWTRLHNHLIMAQRIVIRVLGNTLAPYSPSINLNGAISEDRYVNVTQLGMAKDTTTAQRVQFPVALSYVTVTNQSISTSNHVKGSRVYLNINAAALNALANA